MPRTNFVSYRDWLEYSVLISLPVIARYGFPIPEDNDHSSFIRLIPRFGELAPVVGRDEAIKQMIIEAIRLRTARPDWGIYYSTMALFGIEDEYNGVSFSARHEIAREFYGASTDESWKDRVEELYRELATSMCDGVREPPNEGEATRPVQIELWELALSELLKKGLPVRPNQNAARSLIRAFFGTDATVAMSDEEMSRALVRINNIIEQHLEQFDDEKRRVAHIYFCYESGYKGSSLTRREEDIATIFGVSPRSARNWRAGIISALAWQIFASRSHD